MKEKLYLEYHYRDYLNKILYLNNGFSSCYNLCSNIVSIEMKYDDTECELFHLRNILSTDKYDKVYISIFDSVNFPQIHMMAKEYPDIDFTIGGPGACYLLKASLDLFKLDYLPNFNITSETLESIFTDTFHQRQWGLNLPENIEDDIIVFSMCNSTRPCSWSKCKYCVKIYNINSVQHPMVNFVKNIPEHLKETKKLIVHTGFLDITLEELKEMVPVLNYDTRIYYLSFIRTIKTDQLGEFRKVLSEIKKPERINFFIGGEFFSNRMLEYLNRGLTTDDYVGTIRLLQEMNFKIILSFIHGWNNLTMDDVREFNDTLKKIDCSRVSVRTYVFRTSKSIEQYFKKDFEGLEMVGLPIANLKPGYFFEHTYTLKDSKQIHLNELVVKLLKDRFKEKYLLYDDLNGLGKRFINF